MKNGVLVRSWRVFHGGVAPRKQQIFGKRHARHAIAGFFQALATRRRRARRRTRTATRPTSASVAFGADARPRRSRPLRPRLIKNVSSSAPHLRCGARHRSAIAARAARRRRHARRRPRAARRSSPRASATSHGRRSSFGAEMPTLRKALRVQHAANRAHVLAIGVGADRRGQQQPHAARRARRAIATASAVPSPDAEARPPADDCAAASAIPQQAGEAVAFLRRKLALAQPERLGRMAHRRHIEARARAATRPPPGRTRRFAAARTPRPTAPAPIFSPRGCKAYGQRALVFAPPMVDGVQERLDARDNAHLREVLVHLDLQIGFVAHFLGE